MIRILLADDHQLVREALRDQLEAATDLQVVAEAGTSAETLETAVSGGVDVVVLDLAMPGRGGLEVAREIKRRRPEVRVLILTGHPELSLGVRCLEAGVDGYLEKRCGLDELAGAIRKVCQGRKVVPPELAEQLVERLTGGDEGPPHQALSNRELQVLMGIASGRTVSEIADELCLSPKTVTTYRARMLDKMGLRNNAEVMYYAMQQQLLEGVELGQVSSGRGPAHGRGSHGPSKL